MWRIFTYFFLANSQFYDINFLMFAEKLFLTFIRLVKMIFFLIGADVRAQHKTFISQLVSSLPVDLTWEKKLFLVLKSFYLIKFVIELKHISVNYCEVYNFLMTICLNINFLMKILDLEKNS